MLTSSLLFLCRVVIILMHCLAKTVLQQSCDDWNCCRLITSPRQSTGSYRSPTQWRHNGQENQVRGCYYKVSRTSLMEIGIALQCKINYTMFWGQCSILWKIILAIMSMHLFIVYFKASFIALFCLKTESVLEICIFFHAVNKYTFVPSKYRNERVLHMNLVPQKCGEVCRLVQ